MSGLRNKKLRTGLLACGLAGLACFLFFFRVPLLPRALSDCSPTLIDELMSVGEFYRGPEFNEARSELAYTRSGAGGRRLYFLGVGTGQEREFTNKNEMLRFSGYSSDGQRFLFKSLINGAEALSSCDGKGVPRRVQHHRGLANDAVWITSNTFCFSYSATGDKVLYLATLKGEEEATEELDTQGAATSLTPMGLRKIAFVRESDIWLADFDRKECERFSHLDGAAGGAPKLSSALEWLNYSPEAGEFLFCAGDESNWRHVFRFKKTGQGEKLTQVTFGNEHSYNGKWIQKGKGFAFIGNLTNHFYLAVRPSEPDGATNLFFGGHVIGYCVSRDGERIFATASMGADPPGIWEYSIPTRELRYIGGGPKFSLARVIRRQERWVSSFDGLRVAWFLLEPARLDKSKKYPAVISVPPEGNQFYEAWEKYSQLFANAGVFDVAVNHRAIDGYGNLYKRQNAENSYKDEVAVYRMLRKNPNIDQERIFLRSVSSGERVLEKLVTEYRGRWAGVMIISGYPPPREVDVFRGKKVLLFAGKRDTPALVKANQEFENWAKSNGLAVRSYYAPRTGHGVTDLNVDRNLGTAMMEFIFDRSYSRVPADEKGQPEAVPDAKPPVARLGGPN